MKKEITIFKHYHIGNKIIPKIEKEIKKSDIVMREAAAITKKRAKKRINIYKNFLEKRDKKEIIRALSKRNEHYKKVYLLFYKYKKPFLPAESHNNKDSAYSSKRYKDFKELRMKSLKMLEKGDSSLSLKYSKDALSLMRTLVDERDRVIAKHIINEKEIFKHYPELSKVKKLKILCLVGRSHNPEKYIRRKKDTKVIIKIHEDLEDKYQKNILKNHMKFPLFWAFIHSLRKNNFGDKKTYFIANKIQEKFSREMLISLCKEVKKQPTVKFNEIAFKFFKRKFIKELK